MNGTDILGFTAAIITSSGFVPQILRGYKTKKLEDVSYFMPFVLTVGMSLWLAYGILEKSMPIIVANAFAISCNIVLILMKFRYSIQG